MIFIHVCVHVGFFAYISIEKQESFCISSNWGFQTIISNNPTLLQKEWLTSVLRSLEWLLTSSESQEHQQPTPRLRRGSPPSPQGYHEDNFRGTTQKVWCIILKLKIQSHTWIILKILILDEAVYDHRTECCVWKVAKVDYMRICQAGVAMDRAIIRHQFLNNKQLQNR